MKRSFGVRLAFRQFLEHCPDLDALAAHVAEALPDEWDENSAVVAVEPGGILDARGSLKYARRERPAGNFGSRRK